MSRRAVGCQSLLTGTAFKESWVETDDQKQEVTQVYGGPHSADEGTTRPPHITYDVQ